MAAGTPADHTDKVRTMGINLFVRNRHWPWSLLLMLCGAGAMAGSPGEWWSPGDERPLPAYVEYRNGSGRLGILNTDGPVDTTGHPFFEPLGKHGRGCVTCHQPADGMSLSVPTIVQRWQDTVGRDPLFAMIDGANCPHLPAEDAASHSLLLQRGLFRIALPWPPKDAAGRTV